MEIPNAPRVTRYTLLTDVNESDAIRLASWTFDRAVFDHPNAPEGIKAKAADWATRKPEDHYRLELAKS